MSLTQAQRDAILARAVTAVRARYHATPDTDPTELARLSDVATRAVTDAVTRGGWHHTQIATMAGVTGLRVIALISDWSAQSVAYGRERHAAARYAGQVRESAAAHARQRVGAEGYGAQSALSRDIGVSRVTIDKWIGGGNG